MVFRVDYQDREAAEKRNARLCERLTGEFPGYPGLLAEGMTPTEADRTLTERGSISENDLVKLYCDVLQVEPLDEEEFSLPPKLEGVASDYLVGHCLLPLRWDDAVLTLAAVEPYSLEEHAYALEQFLGRRIEFELTRRTMVERIVTRLYLAPAEAPDPADLEDENRLLQLAGEAGIVRLVNEMLTQALEQGASDIHIEPEEEQFIIRFRVDGLLNEYLAMPISDYPAVASRIKLVGGLNIAESRLPQDGRTNFQLGHYDIDIRISTIPIMNGESIVLRLLHKDSMRFDLRELGMNERLLEQFSELIQIPHGIILVVGPTGSGKTTTLYSVMRQLNIRQRKVITIEDPVEYQLPGLCQMQVNPKIGLNFAGGLRHIVRQDPDVILVGEIRDRETADIAINAALTGHLVLSTLHTNDAVGAVARLLDMGVESFLVASALAGVLSQRLVRKICLVCHGMGQLAGSRCRNCGGTGYRGRTGIYELLLVSDDIRDAVLHHASSSEINRIAQRQGMIPLLEDGRTKVAAGITTEAEVLRTASGLPGGA